MKVKIRVWLRLITVAVLLPNLGCGGQSSGTDGGPQPPPLDEQLKPGQVRAGVITKKSELLQGPEAMGWIGDFKIYNDRVAFVIGNIQKPIGWAYYGGTILDADRVRPSDQPGQEVFQEMFLDIDMLTLLPSSIEVVSDGHDGQPAHIRVQGKEHGLPLIDSFLEGAISPKNLEITQDYILEPNQDYLRVQAGLRSGDLNPIPVTVGDLVLSGDLAEHFIEGLGPVGRAGFSGDLAYFAATHPASCTLVASAADTLRTAVSLEGFTPLEAGRGTAPAHNAAEPLVVERILIVGDGPIDSCLRLLRAYRGKTDTGLVQGTVTTSAGQPEVGAEVFAHATGKPAGQDFVDQAYTSTSGAFEMQLLPGSYTFSVRALGRTEIASTPYTLASGQTLTAALTIPAPAPLTYHCRGQDREGADTGPIPCKISFQAGHGAAFGAPTLDNLLTFGASGDGTVPIPPGDYTITFSHGWEYGISRQDITISEGTPLDLSAALPHQVDTTGYLAADIHNHSGRSPETHFPVKDKLAANVCEGVEVMVATDHDCQNDFSSQLAELSKDLSYDLTPWIRLVVGNEVSPMNQHFTTFPLPVPEVGWAYWQIPYAHYTNDVYDRTYMFPELWSRARELGAEIINIAHPVGDKGYFSNLGFAPPNTFPRISSLPADKFNTGFDTVELLNSTDVGKMLDQILPVWSSFNNQGVFKTATGTSDAHVRTHTPGFGRTMVQSPTDDPSAVNLTELWNNLKERRAEINGGIFIRIAIDQAGPGDLISKSGTFDVFIHAEAPDWEPVQEMQLIGNGQVVATVPLSAPRVIDAIHPAVRFDGTISVSPSSDTWYVAVAYGKPGDTMGPVCPGCRPVGMTNAIQVDVDGNGQFDAPEK